MLPELLTHYSSQEPQKPGHTASIDHGNQDDDFTSLELQMMVFANKQGLNNTYENCTEFPLPQQD